jgi:hypothetical protein
MSVSILINNYNYARYVGRAIDSALAQSWRDCQIVVVDDGSTDDSWQEIQRFRGRVSMLRQDNGGQGAAYNAGWQHAEGEFVLFLDADDLLDPGAIEQAMKAVQRVERDARDGRRVATVSWRMRTIDADGHRAGGFTPYLMHGGDVRPVIRRFGHYAGPPASGNLYRREAIAAAFPLHAPQWRRAADTVPFIFAPFHDDASQVVALPHTLGSYRLHRKPRMGVFGNIDSTLRAALLIAENRRSAMVDMLRERIGVGLEGPFLPLPWTLRTRALSWRLDRASHPFIDDDAARILSLQRQSLREWPGYLPAEKLLMTTWVAAALHMPKSMLQSMAATATSGMAKAAVKRLMGGAR